MAPGGRRLAASGGFRSSWGALARPRWRLPETCFHPSTQPRTSLFPGQRVGSVSALLGGAHLCLISNALCFSAAPQRRPPSRPLRALPSASVPRQAQGQASTGGGGGPQGAGRRGLSPALDYSGCTGRELAPLLLHPDSRLDHRGALGWAPPSSLQGRAHLLSLISRSRAHGCARKAAGVTKMDLFLKGSASRRQTLPGRDTHPFLPD